MPPRSSLEAGRWIQSSHDVSVSKATGIEVMRSVRCARTRSADPQSNASTTPTPKVSRSSEWMLRSQKLTKRPVPETAPS